MGVILAKMIEEKIYPIEEFNTMLEYLQQNKEDIKEFIEHYKNLLTPIQNLENFFQFVNSGIGK